MTSANEIQTRLLELRAERALASIEGLAVNSAYMADLDVRNVNRGARHLPGTSSKVFATSTAAGIFAAVVRSSLTAATTNSLLDAALSSALAIGGT